MMRNLGEDQQGHGKGQDVKEDKLGRRCQEGAKSDSTLPPPLNPRPVCTKTNARMHPKFNLV
jgi:hypothetical protein